IGYEHMIVPIYRESPWRIKPAAEELVRPAVGIDPRDRCPERVCHPHVAAAVDRQTQRPFERARGLGSRKTEGGKQGAIRCELHHRVAAGVADPHISTVLDSEIERFIEQLVPAIPESTRV